MSSRKVVIVGGGVLGLSCAVELASAGGLDVTVVERRYVGAGSTSLSVGVFTRQYVTAADIELRIRGVRQFELLEREHGLKMRRIGVMRLARDAEMDRSFEASAELQRELGVDDVAVLAPEDVERLLPRCDLDGVTSAIYSPSEGYVDGMELCGLLGEMAQARGVELVARRAVTGLERGTRAAYEVQTDGEPIPADLVVNCAGAWAAQVGAALGAPVRVVNERHEAHVFNLPPGFDHTVPVTIDYSPGQDGEGLYFRQEGGEQLIAGMHSNDVLGEDQVEPDQCFGGATQEHADVVIERLASAFPDVDIGYKGGWAGIYPHSPIGRPYVGPHPHNPDVLVGGGLGGNGLSVSPGLGAFMAEWIRLGSPEDPLAEHYAFDPAVAADDLTRVQSAGPEPG